MRVLHVIDGIGLGGAELVLVQLVEHLQRRGVENTILSLTPCVSLKERILASGARLEEMRFEKGRLPLRGLGQPIAAMRRARPDVIQGWMYHGNFAAGVLRDLCLMRTPMLWSMHNTLEPPPEFSRVTRLAFEACRLAAFRAKHIVYVSQASAEQHAARNFRRDRGVFIPNGTDCEKFKPDALERKRLRGALGVGEETRVLGCFARWHPMKGHVNLLAAAAALKAKGRPLHLVFAGTGMERANPDLVAAISAAGLDADCTLLGERHDVERLLAGLDGLVLPSVYGEAFPMILGEAMATGLVCVATDVGDCRHLLGDAGVVVPPGNVGALANAMAVYFDDAPLRRAEMAARARSRVRREFSMERMVDAYHALYIDSCRTPVAARPGASASVGP